MPSADPNLCIKVPVVIGQNSCEVMVVTQVPLSPPLFEIKDIAEDVSVDNCLVQNGLVIINGTLHKDINYKTLDGSVQSFDGGQIATGDVVHTTVWLPFHCFIDVANALEGDDCQIESATVIGEKDEPKDPNDGDPTFNTLLEKAVIRIVAKVTRTEQLTVSATQPGVCPT